MGQKYNRSIFKRGTARYKDIDISFLTNPATSDVRTKTDNDAIKQAMTNLLYTHYGERPFEFSKAGNLDRLLFENMDQITKFELEKGIEKVLRSYEPRVTLLNVLVKPYEDDNRIEINITYNISNELSPQVVKVILHRVR